MTVAAGGTYKATWPVTVQPAQDQVDRRSEPRSGGQLSDAVEITLPVYRYTTPEVVGTSGQVGLDESRLELVRFPAERGPDAGRARRDPGAQPGRGHDRRPDLPGALPVRVHRADHEPLPAQRRLVPGAEGAGHRAARSRDHPAAAGRRGTATALRQAAHGRRLGLVAERPEQRGGLGLRRLRAGKGQGGRLHR